MPVGSNSAVSELLDVPGGRVQQGAYSGAFDVFSKAPFGEEIMQLRERQVDGEVVVELSGEGIGAEPSILKPFVSSLLDRGHRRIVLDFEHLRSMDSTCLAEIIAAYKEVVAAGGVLKLAHVNGQIRRLLHLTKVDTLLELYDSDAEAIASFDRTGH